MSFRHRPDVRLWVFGLGLAVLGACGSPETSVESAAPETVIAEDRLGPITLADVDRFILELRPDQRWQSESEPADWYSTMARRLAVDRLLHDEAMLSGADQDPDFQRLERRILRNVYSDHYLSEVSVVDPLTDEELRAYYDEHQERFDREERREISHVFKRFPEDGSRESVIAEMETIRGRALAGESFEILARQHSDSETRHDGGRLGFVPRGRFSEDFDRIAFALEVGVPSEALVTGDGVHVLLVTSILEARSFSFEDVKRVIRQELAGARRGEWLAEAATDLPRPQDSFIPDREAAARLLRSGDPSAIVLRLGDFLLTARQLQELVQDVRRLLGARREPDLAFRVLEEIGHREVIYQHLMREGLPEISSDQIDRERRRQLLEHYSRRKMTAFLERRPERIQTHYDNNVLRFSSPVRVHVRHLAVPLGGAASEAMGKLESARPGLDAGERDLADLAEELGGQVRDLGLVTAAQLQAADPRALRFAFLLEPGEHSPPYQVGRALAMFQVATRQDAVPLPLARVRDRVVTDYLTHYSAPVFQELADELLETSGFQIFEERLEGVGPIVETG